MCLPCAKVRTWFVETWRSQQNKLLAVWAHHSRNQDWSYNWPLCSYERPESPLKLFANCKLSQKKEYFRASCGIVIGKFDIQWRAISAAGGRLALVSSWGPNLWRSSRTSWKLEIGGLVGYQWSGQMNLDETKNASGVFPVTGFWREDHHKLKFDKRVTQWILGQLDRHWFQHGASWDIHMQKTDVEGLEWGRCGWECWTLWSGGQLLLKVNLPQSSNACRISALLLLCSMRFSPSVWLLSSTVAV